MTKPKVAFLDHPFHQKTGSSNFFVDFISEDFDVDVFYYEPDPRAVMREIAQAGYDIVVCWQTEFCAPYFLMRGLRVVCIPMYDGVANAPDSYWLAMRQARFINFSRVLHRRLQGLGIESYHFQYFKKPVEVDQEISFEALHAFFWQRRPEYGLDYKFAKRLVGDCVASLHIHNAPDTLKAEDWKPGPGYTVSVFTETGESYREALAKSNVYICPRHTEGIGMAMLEALSRGMCVIAHDAPTANEYIDSGTNGILVDYDSKSHLSTNRRGPLYLDKEKAQRLGRAARENYLLGYREWLETKKMIPFLIHSAPQPDLSAGEMSMAEKYLNVARYAPRDFGVYLRAVGRLQARGMTGYEYSTMRLMDHLSFRLRSLPIVRPVGRQAKRLLRGVANRLRS
jgi:hypothetical protein